MSRHSHEPFPLSVPLDCPLCPQHLDQDGRPIRNPHNIGTTADRRLDGAAADDYHNRERHTR